MKVEIFTAGTCSKKTKIGGWATIFKVKNCTKHFLGKDENVTKNRMELRAIVEAMEIIENTKGWINHRYIFYIESAYILNSIEKVNKWQRKAWKIGNGQEIKNKELWQEFNRFRRRMNNKNVVFDFVKVAERREIIMNDWAGLLAKGQNA